MENSNIFKDARIGDYQNENFKKFLKNIKFNFNLPGIHIAGTNGKGSTANYIANIYQAAGLKVGLYTSPYLFNINEMISINGENIADADIEKIYKNNEKVIKKHDLSEFEIMTFVAFTYFMNAKCDLVVIECGMGGEFDATNIFTPILSIITSISLEHTSYLGRTISEVAYHKAGIIKECVPVVVGDLNEEAMNVINETCKNLDTKATTTVEPSNVRLDNDGLTFDYLTYRDLKIKSKGLYSVYDARIAVEAVNVLQDFKAISNEEMQKGLFNVSMDCRMDIVSEKPLIIIDGGHNPEGIFNLKKAILNLNFENKIHVVFSCFKDKNMQKMLAEIGSFSDSAILTTFNHPRARGYEDYFLFAEDYEYEENAQNAIANMIEKYPEDMIIITGSLAFAAYVKQLFNSGKLK